MNNNKYKYIVCTNCGKIGHEFKSCTDPITSWGIILLDIDNNDDKNDINITDNNDIDDNSKIHHDIIDLKNNIIGINLPTTYSDAKLMSHHMKSIKFLLIRRKHSLGFVEFVRGRYKPDNIDGINYLFQQMTSEEIKKIGEQDFDKLWRDLWSNDEHKIENMHKEYLISKEKFELLRDNKTEIELPLDFYVKNVKSTYGTQEWGFPKGRRNRNESEIDCAIREFSEETGIDKNDINIISEITPIEENLTGTNGIKYRHIYYVAETKRNILPTITSSEIQLKEISGIGFFTFDDAYSLIRDYHVERKNILVMIFMYYVEKILNNMKNKS